MNYQIINNDCRDYLNGEFCPQFDMIFADPPFNIGQDYIGYNDSVDDKAYRNFSKDWIIDCWNKLKPGGAMVIHGSVKCSQQLIVLLNNIKKLHYVETEIVWSYNFGQCQFTDFIQTHCRALVLRKPGSPRKWYVKHVLTESKRLLMGDNRCETSRFRGYIPHGTVWGLDDVDGVIVEPITAQANWGRVQGNNKERRPGHPNQLPERYVARTIMAYTQPDDLVFDPFGGSGTTIAVAQQLGRNCITTEIGAQNCQSIKSRLNEKMKHERIN